MQAKSNAFSRALCGAAFAIWAGTSLGAAPLVIRDDPGGSLRAYGVAVDLAILAQRPVRIEGWCASACTLYLASPYVCVTQGAQLAFHAPRGGSRAANRRAAHRMADRLPAPIAQWYLTNAAHLDGEDYLSLSGGEIAALAGVRLCS